jgi:succinoglycan biosynthesis transport protein ExoP
VPLLTYRAPAFDDVSRAPLAADRELEDVARSLVSGEGRSRKVTVLGTGRSEAISATALTLARKMASHARIVLVDLSEGAVSARAASIDPEAPTLADLIRGEASFGQIVTRDGRTGLHLVAGGEPGADRALLQSPRVTMMLDALFRVYDHIVLDVGTSTDLPAALLTSEARAVVVPDVAMTADAKTRYVEQLRTIGFADVTILSGAVAGVAAQTLNVAAA